jgi:ribosomal protein L19
MNLIAQIEAEQIAQLGKEIPDFKAGDTIRIGYKVTEGTRSRVQNFEGVCIARKGGHRHRGIVHRAQNFLRRRRGTCIPAVFDQYRQHRSCASWPCAPCEAVLPARPSR